MAVVYVMNYKLIWDDLHILPIHSVCLSCNIDVFFLWKLILVSLYFLFFLFLQEDIYNLRVKYVAFMFSFCARVKVKGNCANQNNTFKGTYPQWYASSFIVSLLSIFYFSLFFLVLLFKYSFFKPIVFGLLFPNKENNSN
jgi:hypothetical protein